jgi:isopentenyl-diphosphate delta-isomerase
MDANRGKEAGNFMERVILVDNLDNEIGTAGKLEAHRNGQLHRAFSIFVFNENRQLLLQKRARTKYHSGGLWSNTCCGHPRPGESTPAAANRRLGEEFRFYCELRNAFQFLYRTELTNALVEHEYDHVLVGRFDGDPLPDESEVEAWKWVGIDDLTADMAKYRSRYTYWLNSAMQGENLRKIERVLDIN